MAEITTVFFDLGGVLLTNGWDRLARRRAVEHFHLDGEDFEDRHDLVVARLETGHLTLERYLERTVFYRPRNFSKEEFREFMFAQSQPLDASLELLGRLARAGKYFMGTLNNESRELNQYRIERFQLRKYFSVFFTSCFLGVKKPDDEIYRLALDLSQRRPAECVFIDDRELNVECARHVGIRAVQFRDAAQLEGELREAGLDF